ncbi:hypothetical protein CDO51_02050 [Natranaerobius trueperi]|uniref:Penicillin-binding protein 1A n=1 Tax=Natranaerobius trueperi TaxID=759412 RepID=A0A226C047_9FIRM|nr:hypothetical protein CDO51_02050 [Natranaerobius trueperi]
MIRRIFSPRRWFRVFFLTAVILFFAVIVLVPFVVGALEDTPPPGFNSASILLDREGEEFHYFYDDYRLYTPLEEMPEELIKGMIAIEDRRFREHNGIDIRGIGRAAIRNLRARDILEGGSTITQQVAKNYYLDHSRTIDRKIREMFLTLHLERTLSKKEIMEQYLNGIYFGHGVYGIETASRYYFNKNVNDLEIEEIALLIGLPRGPNLYSPLRNPDNAYDRRNAVLSEMASEEVITEEKAQIAQDAEIDIEKTQGPLREAPYFAEEVRKRLRQKLPQEYHEQINQGGLRVYTSLDQNMQINAQTILDEELVVTRGEGEDEIRQPQGAIVALDPNTGYISTLVGGRDYHETQLNRANPGVPRRHAGSVFKAYTYMAALSEREISAASVVTCEQTEFPPEPGRDEPYIPSDYGGTYHNEDLTIRRAIRESCNVTAIKVHDMIGRTPSVKMAEELGIERSVSPWVAFPMGQIGVRPLEVTSSYAPFANGGISVEPSMIKRVEDSSGRVIYDEDPEKSVVLSEQEAYLMTDLLRDVLGQNGTASNIQVNFDAAGKTGTSQGHKDAVFVGYTPDLVVSVFITDDENQEALPGTGGSLAAPLWESFMNSIQGELDLGEFTRPDGLIIEEICEESGQLVTPSCPNETVIEENFLPNTVPEKTCEVHEEYEYPDDDDEDDDFDWPWWPFN